MSLNFSHNYDKLANEMFTTIRGKTHPLTNKLKEGMIITILLKRNFLLKAKIRKIEYRKIQDIPLSFLKFDAEYKGHIISTKDDFIKLINTFRRYHKATLNSSVAIYYLKKVKSTSIIDMLKTGAKL